MDFFGDQFQTDLFAQLGEPIPEEDDEDRKIKDMPMIEVIRRLPTKNPTQSALMKMRKQETKKENKKLKSQNENKEAPNQDNPDKEIQEGKPEEANEDEHEDSEHDINKEPETGIKIVNGNLVIDSNAFEENEDMLYYQRATRAHKQATVADGKPITSASFVQREHTSKWTNEETSRFYDAIRLFGTDFMLIHSAMPERSLTQLKRKFKLEESKHPAFIQQLLTSLCTLLPFSFSLFA